MNEKIEITARSTHHLNPKNEMLSNDFNCTTDLSMRRKKKPHQEDHFVTFEKKNNNQTMHPYTSLYHPSLSSFINPFISTSTMPFMHGASDRFTGNLLSSCLID